VTACLKDTTYRLYFVSSAADGEYAAGDVPQTYFHRELLRKLHKQTDVLEWVAYFNRLHRYHEIRTGDKQKLQVKKGTWKMDYVIAWRETVRLQSSCICSWS
jgi:hypothetical protein